MLVVGGDSTEQIAECNIFQLHWKMAGQIIWNLIHSQTTNLIPNACSHITYISVHVMVHSVTLARTDILPEDGPMVPETFRRFYEILAF